MIDNSEPNVNTKLMEPGDVLVYDALRDRAGNYSTMYFIMSTTLNPRGDGRSMHLWLYSHINDGQVQVGYHISNGLPDVSQFGDKLV